ncbi:Flp pilus assembly protein CpaB [Iamia sp. SCSIO 61187]|uniref:Flp pilus assembly protein CpaB n=1 Tax=Iamia sp. SCSIO 61187 TaxID=2722752 RepID=UPI001C63901F|nr:Flp pilus assembly protein CpaB [Iamia sp. SCSIO 61187]QYG93326.1 Flp pilus assembly protein CpaB [Iamia sp. SCSIO 61187]
MGSRRTLITIAALAVGAMAVFLIYGYVSSVKDEAFGDAERVKVFVVKQTVPKGTYGEEASASTLVAEDEIPKRFWPENAIRSLDDIAGKVAVGDLAVNQVVTTDMFADPSTVQTTFSDRLEKINDEDQVAITIQVDQVRGVAGLLQPGDFVNIMATQVCELAGDGLNDGSTPAPEQPADEATEPSSGADCLYGDDVLFGSQARYIYQKVQILAIDQTPVQLPGEATTAAEGEAVAAEPALSSGLITLIVPARAAQVVASIEPERFYLTLVPRDYEPVPQEVIDPTEPFAAEDPDALTPYGPDGPGGE